MAERTELLEATLDNLPEGVALLSENCRVVYWNHAAQAITGYAAQDVVGRSAPETLKPLLDCCPSPEEPGGCATHSMHQPGHGFPVYARHKLGHEVSAMARLLVLRDGLGARIGTAILFHPAECIDSLPHGACGEDEGLKASLEDLKDRLENLFEDFVRDGPSFGVLWVSVDQAHDLRKTHGAGACEAMLKKIERTLARGLRPGEQLGRWGEDEFLVISHERTAPLLAAHAQTLGGLARTADFHWWGDRVSLTVSIGAAQAEKDAPLAALLERAEAAMQAGFHAGGNQITSSPEGPSCLPS